jgi:hypothetical protein
MRVLAYDTSRPIPPMPVPTASAWSGPRTCCASRISSACDNIPFVAAMRFPKQFAKISRRSGSPFGMRDDVDIVRGHEFVGEILTHPLIFSME